MTRKTKQNWLEAGRNIILQQGAGGLTIEALLQRVGVTKGSFYHHFKGHADYVARFLEYYEQEGTLDIIELCNSEPTPTLRVQKLLLISTSYPPEAEVEMRTWAQNDDRVRAVVERVDEQRMAYVTDLFFAITKDEAAATQLAQLMVTIFVGSQHVMPPLSGATQRQLVTTALAGLGIEFDADFLSSVNPTESKEETS